MKEKHYFSMIIYDGGGIIIDVNDTTRERSPTVLSVDSFFCERDFRKHSTSSLMGVLYEGYEFSIKGEVENTPAPFQFLSGVP